MGFSLLLQLLLVQTCIRASWGLQCVLCDITGSCQVKECAPDQNLCRTTAIHTWQESEDLELVERGCAHPEKTNRTMSYRTGVKIITLTEAVCESDLCNRPKPGRVVTFPRSRYLECVSCASSDLSCERGLDRSLQCRSPGEECLDMVTHHSLEVLELRNLPLNGLQCYSCEGNRTHGCSSEETSLTDCRGPMSRCLEATGTHELGNQSYIVRGCATPSWCQGLHVAEAFRLTHFDVSCCIGNRCNDPMLDIQPRRGGAPRPGPDHLSFTIGTLLVTARLWGGTLLCT
ncbi:plasminogen activator, urokinase receptor [Rhinolophus ferrumequinum]|uniref:Urokinase plasminogen activator surface receptor n=1 Tax=Rhinolophus ferrumequinum TaxID=59479 RepID=A0A7J7SJZ8_RHIFE|nr:plasminogen activator, urokinase receptor [Rhinolophus ferrumequinum]